MIPPPTPNDPSRPPALHASCVAFDGRAVLILGPSGAGKSAFALQLMAYGGDLVADDRVLLIAQAGRLIASRPHSLPKLIEARHVGLLHATGPDHAEVVLAADLATTEPARLPQHHYFQALGLQVPLMRVLGLVHGPAAVRQYILAGRQDVD